MITSKKCEKTVFKKLFFPTKIRRSKTSSLPRFVMFSANGSSISRASNRSLKSAHYLRPKEVSACANTRTKSLSVDGKRRRWTAGSRVLRQSGETKTCLVLPRKQIFLQSPCLFYLRFSPPYSRGSEVGSKLVFLQHAKK